jgi:hypothetical protein
VTALESPGLRQLALNALALRAGSAADARTLAAAAQRAYEDLARVSAPLIGDVSLNALTGRTLFLAQQHYPWLIHTRAPEQWRGPFDQIVFCLERQDPVVATEAAGAVLATLMGLLVTFIGEPLTAQLLRKAWPDAFAATRLEER